MKGIYAVAAIFVWVTWGTPAPAQSGGNCVANGSDYEICVSSFLPPSKVATYGPENLFDPVLAWCEGGAGDGVGEEIFLRINNGARLTGIEIQNGYSRTAKTYRENARVRSFSIETDKGGFGQTVLQDSPDTQTLEFFPDRYEWVSLVVTSVYPGTKYEDLCVNVVWPDLN
ncbi:MAG: hypothetical protein ACE5DK_11905 [Paracoccaceae bacterium]